MKKLILLIISIFTCIACDKINPFTQLVPKKFDPEVALYRELGLLADSTYVVSKDIRSLIEFKIIDSNNKIEKVTSKKAFEVYQKNWRLSKSNEIPIFEIKNSDKVIISAFGRGQWDRIWAFITIDKKNLKIVDISIDHIAETPGLGGQINKSDFEKQFIGSTIDFTKNNFALIQNDTILITGKNKIDGISGATITVQSIITSMNQDLKKYEFYFH